MDTLLNADSSYILSKDTLTITELRLTKHFFEYVKHAYAGKVDPEKMQWHIPRGKLEPVTILDSPAFSFRANAATRSIISAFTKRTFRYKSIQQNSGWNTIDESKRKLKPDDKNNIISAIKKRLQTSGDYDKSDTSSVFTKAFEDAIKKAEISYGLKADGVIDNVLMKQLNVTVDDRIKKMLINLERMKWMPEEPSNYLLANIPEYRLHVVENGKEVLAMNIVLGKAANRSVIFSDELKFVVFSPYWNIPRSIVRNEIVPGMNRSKNYLSRKNMEITGYSGGLPVVRQKPGCANALGNVKFIFPNS